MPTLVACLWRRVEAIQLGRVPTHFGPATRLRRPKSQWNQGSLATSQVEMCPRTANSGLVAGRPALHPRVRLGAWQRLLEAAPARGVELGMAFLDGTSIRAHHKAAGAPKKGGPRANGTGARR